MTKNVSLCQAASDGLAHAASSCPQASYDKDCAPRTEPATMLMGLRPA